MCNRRYLEKIQLLEDWLKREERVIVAFSGGIDSALLVVLTGKILGKNMIAVTADSPSLPSRDRLFITTFCKEYNIEHKFIKSHEFNNKMFLSNPENRCYYCKTELYKELVDYAKLNRCKSVLDGTNSSDLSGHRPGYKAITEIEGVKTPYVELDITKDDIRKLASKLKISIANKPSSACLSSRIPFGSELIPEELAQVDRAENFLRDLGLTQVRVRHHGKLARIQCINNETYLIIGNRKVIEEELKIIGYKHITLDLNCYE